ncbi:hypothetical protein CLV30_109181 [Haloactinopolyspora alba]|uniref:Uncharacterized protein n=1 Tax=Haloactinopolyspora alba TaxID=648780 RepID=A0A2P8E078_9ACTN|nr:hypothetical protein [Haloactinopolyspora alba]PSL02873.1 hypothetical protein CLV30_109181 [Haloactinopolyspora alba]
MTTHEIPTELLEADGQTLTPEGSMALNITRLTDEVNALTDRVAALDGKYAAPGFYADPVIVPAGRGDVLVGCLEDDTVAIESRPGERMTLTPDQARHLIEALTDAVDAAETEV